MINYLEAEKQKRAACEGRKGMQLGGGEELSFGARIEWFVLS